MKLAGLARAGELTPIYVPEMADEAMRDLVRAREDAVVMQRQARQRLAALLLRNDVRYAGKTAWTAAHRRWIADIKLPQQAQRLAFEEYIQAIEEATLRAARLTHYIEQEVTHWRWLSLVNALQTCRGIQLIHAVRIASPGKHKCACALGSPSGCAWGEPQQDRGGDRARAGRVRVGDRATGQALNAATALPYSRPKYTHGCPG